MTKANECTCPSGDGSLRHPCPAHPAVEQAGGDERAAFELFVRKHCGMPEHIAVNWDAKFTNDAWEAWQARAALAQPSPVPEEEKPGDRILCYGCFAKGVGPDHFDEAGKCLVRQQLDPLNLAPHAKAFNEAPAEALKPEQAEAEMDFSRPLETENGEPVKWICADVIEYKSARVCVAKDTGLVYSSPYIGLKIRNVMPEQAEAERPEVVGVRYEDGTILSAEDCGTALEVCAKVQTPLMTVAQHERIVGALRFERQQMDRAFTACINERDAANARLHEVATACATAEEERDAALARVAELEMLLRELNTSGLMQFSTADEEKAVRAALSGAQAQHSAGYAEARMCANCRHIGINDAGADGNCPECGGFYELEAQANVPSQAQHSVPEDHMIVPREVFQMLRDASFKWSHASRGLRKTADDLLAAAPGTEVPQAWLDVQAERKRQITAEGWTPEHDDAHSHGQIARAAACYALAGSSAPNDGTAALLVSLAWPWDEQWWKPTSARRDMVKACALGLAEIERLDRAAAPGKEVGHE